MPLQPQTLALIGLKLVSFNFTEKEPITDKETLLQLRDILEETYTDGITAIKQARLDKNDNFTGIFEDAVSPALTKRYKFTITDDDVSYQLLNPGEADNFNEASLLEFSEQEWINFARSKMFGGTKNQTKSCKKGSICGGTCIASNRKCHKEQSPAAKAKTKAAKTKAAKTKAVKERVKGETSKKTPEKTVTPAVTTKVATTKKGEVKAEKINYKVNRYNHKELIELGNKFSQQYLKPIAPSAAEKKAEANLEKHRAEFKKIQEAGEISTTKARKFIDAQNKYFEHVNERQNKEAAQFKKLKDAVLEKHNISEAQAEKWADSNTHYYGSNLSKDTKAQAEVKETLKEVYRLSGGKSGNSFLYVSSDADRAFATREGHLDTGNARHRNTIYHEYGHHIEYRTNGTAESARDWVESRASSKIPEKLKDLTQNLNYRDDEVAIPGNFITPYVGKISGEKGSATEVISMGVEQFSNSKDMKKFYEDDKEHFNYTLGVLLSED